MEQKKGSSLTRCEAITNLINSIAKEEEAIAKILKAIEEKKDNGKAKPWWGDEECQAEELESQGFLPDKDKGKDKEKDKVKEEEKLQLINALARIEFLITSKLYLFIDCVCPEDGYKDKEKEKPWPLK